MRELLDAEATDNRNFVYIYVYYIIHCMGSQANNFAKEVGLRWRGPCRQASLDDYDVIGSGDGDRF